MEPHHPPGIPALPSTSICGSKIRRFGAVTQETPSARRGTGSGSRAPGAASAGPRAGLVCATTVSKEGAHGG